MYTFIRQNASIVNCTVLECCNVVGTLLPLTIVLWRWWFRGATIRASMRLSEANLICTSSLPSHSSASSPCP